MIDLDLTLFIQLANFLVTMVMLNVLLIRPVRDIIRRRRELSDGMAETADSLNSRAARLLAQYENALQLAREEGNALCQTARQEAENNSQALLAAAGTDAQETLSRARETTKKDIASTREQIHADIPLLAETVVEKLTCGLAATK